MADLTKFRWQWLSCKTRLFGCLLILQGENISHLSFSKEAHAKAIDFLRRHGITTTALPHQAPLANRIQRMFLAYQAGNRNALPAPFFASPFWAEGSSFQQRVWMEISRIPYGATCTYGELAGRLGQPQAARAVGQACHANPLALIIPCHRVVAAHALGGFAGSVEIKQKLLALEQGAAT